MKKALAIAILFMFIVFGSIDRSEHAIHRDIDASVAFNSLYVYRTIKRIDIILTITGYREAGHITVNEVYVRYGNGHRHKVNWEPMVIQYGKSLRIDDIWYPQEVRISLSGDVINWTRIQALHVGLVIDHHGYQFIIANVAERW